MIVTFSPVNFRYSHDIEAGDPVEFNSELVKLTIAAFDKGVLRRLAGPDGMQRHLSSFCRDKHRFAGELGVVVAHHRFR